VCFPELTCGTGMLHHQLRHNLAIQHASTVSCASDNNFGCAYTF
jgi:hypothetical protein